MSDETLCSGDNGTCPNPAREGSLCWGHAKRRRPSRQKPAATSGLGRPKLPPGAPIEPRARNPLQALARSGRELADADAEMSNDKFQNVEERFRGALRRYVAKWHSKRSAKTSE